MPSSRRGPVLLSLRGTTRPPVVTAASATDGIDQLGRRHECGRRLRSYFRSFMPGDHYLNNTQGQGILLVDGDLNIQGSYQFFGMSSFRVT